MSQPDTPTAEPTLLLDKLVGTWVGEGRGRYPTISPFSYNERVTFIRSPKGHLVYQQATSHPGTGAPMHSETGYLRVVSRRDAEFLDVELVVAQPTGVVEAHSGTCHVADGGRFELTLLSTGVLGTPTAKRVDTVSRHLTVDGDILTYEVQMASVGLPLQHHLAATLHRQP